MLEKEDIKGIAKHRRIITNLIVMSSGYFTPSHALRVIQCFKKGVPSYCEWYLSITERHFQFHFHPEDYGVEKFQDLSWNIKLTLRDGYLLYLNARNIELAFKERHDIRRDWDFKSARQCVKHALQGYEHMGASWF